jgi:hypothetical protein
MTSGAFRDASAAIERATILEAENAELRAELADMARLRIQVEELDKLRTEVEKLRALARTENEGAYVKRLGEERDELGHEVRSLRERLADQEREIARERFEARKQRTLTGPALVDRLMELFRSK